MRLNRTAEKCAAFTIFTESRTCFRGWFLHELRVRFGGLTNSWPIRGQNLGHSSASFRVRWRTPVAKKRSARSKFIFFVQLVKFLLNNLVNVLFSSRKQRAKEEAQSGAESQRKGSQTVTEGTLRLWYHSSLTHVVECLFNFSQWKYSISQAQSTPASENKKKDELDEESLDPNVRGNSFRVFVFESVKPIARVLFFLLPTSVFMIFFYSILRLTRNNLELHL